MFCNYILFVFLMFLSIFPRIQTLSKHPILIVVSYDAFRFDYINSKDTPFMYKLMKEGSTTHHVTSIFPTKTFPNHFTIATGLYAEIHGVMGNSLFDPKLKKVIGRSYELYHYREDIEPLWIRNEKMGDGRHSGNMMWPGGNFSYQDFDPTFTVPWTREMPLSKRVETVISWITHPETPANLVFMYFEQPDLNAHCYGIQSPKFYQILQELDNTTRYLDELLQSYGLKDRVNVVHLSDHGMVNVKHENILNITGDLEPGSFQTAETSPFLHIIPAEGKEEYVYQKLKNVSRTNKNFQVLKRSEMPDRWHYKNNERAPPILALGNIGYVFQDFQLLIEKYGKQIDQPMSPESEHGVHGYDNTVLEMAGFFIGRGPAFKQKYTIPPFNNVDYYNLFCSILKMRPAANNGSFSNIVSMLTSNRIVIEDDDNAMVSFLAVLAGGILLTIACLACVGGSMLCAVKQKRKSEILTLSEKRYADDIQYSGHLQNPKSSVEAQQLLISDDSEEIST